MRVAFASLNAFAPGAAVAIFCLAAGWAGWGCSGAGGLMGAGAKANGKAKNTVESPDAGSAGSASTSGSDLVDDPPIAGAEVSVEVSGAFLTLACERAPGAKVPTDMAPFGCGFLDKATGKPPSLPPTITSVKIKFQNGAADESPALGAAQGNFAVTFGVTATLVPKIASFGASFKDDKGQDQILGGTLATLVDDGLPKVEVFDVPLTSVYAKNAANAGVCTTSPLKESFLHGTEFCDSYCADATNFPDRKMGIGHFKSCDIAGGTLTCECVRGSEPKRFSRPTVNVSDFTKTDFGPFPSCDSLGSSPYNGFFPAETGCTRLCRMGTIDISAKPQADESQIGFMVGCEGTTLSCGCATSAYGDGVASVYLDFTQLPKPQGFTGNTFDCTTNADDYLSVSSSCRALCATRGYSSGMDHECQQNATPPVTLCLCFR